MLQLSKHQKKELARFERVCRNERKHRETFHKVELAFEAAREHIIEAHGGTLTKLAED